MHFSSMSIYITSVCNMNQWLKWIIFLIFLDNLARKLQLSYCYGISISSLCKQQRLHIHFLWLSLSMFFFRGFLPLLAILASIVTQLKLPIWVLYTFEGIDYYMLNIFIRMIFKINHYYSRKFQGVWAIMIWITSKNIV